MTVRRLSVTLASLAGVAALVWPLLPRGEDSAPSTPPRSVKELHAGRLPSDWFIRQRAWPQDDIDPSARLAAYAESRVLRARSRSGDPWVSVGPVNIGGRIADVACHPTDPAVVYLGTASGGVWKTTNGGTSWAPLFDEESTLSIGCVTLDPSDPDVVYVGTGEPNGGGGSVTYGGTGLFRSTNAGATWTNLGLAATRFIARVVVDPADPDRILVAALGSMWTTGPDRGVYRSTDGGTSFQPVLQLGNETGAIDLAIDPTNPDRVYAAMWERTRGPNFLNYGGDGSGIWRSTDGGTSWAELTSGLPAGPAVGRIGISLARSQPSVLYAIYADASPGYFDGLFKSTNGGDTWTQTNDGALANVYASYGWWFGNIRVSPSDPNRVFALGFDFFRTTNGGSSWQNAAGGMHVDHHGLDFAADGSIWEGNDGGIYRSANGGTVWSEFENMPVTQFYTVEVDEQFPERRYGGTQDNGTNRTVTGAGDDWEHIYGGDGFRCLVDPLNNQYMYAEYQYGGLARSTNGGASFTGATSGLTGRKNWSMPYEIDPSLNTRLYAGTDRVFRSTNRAASWTALSGDLTDGDGGLNGYVFGTITTLAVSPSNPDAILIGTDDANVWITTNGGSTWTRVDKAPIPERWITRVAFDPYDDAVGYVTVSGFRWDEYQPHVLRTSNHGTTWDDISGNLPQAPVNDIVADPWFQFAPPILYVATDFGAYRTADGGANWEALGAGLPNVVVTDLELHTSTRTLTAATYGRSQWTLQVLLPLDSSLGPEVASGLKLAPPRPNPVRAGAPVSIRWSQPRAAEATVGVHDVAGRRIATLTTGPREAGQHAITWDGRDDSGRRVAAGVLFVRLEVAGETRSARIVRLR